MSNYPVNTIIDAWNDSHDSPGSDGRKVYAESPGSDGIAEIYGFTGSNEDGSLFVFADCDEAADFAETIRRRGCIMVADCNYRNGDWILVDLVDTNGWND